MKDRKRNKKFQESSSRGFPGRPTCADVRHRSGNQPVRASTPTLWVASGRKLTENLRNFSYVSCPERSAILPRYWRPLPPRPRERRSPRLEGRSVQPPDVLYVIKRGRRSVPHCARLLR